LLGPYLPAIWARLRGRHASRFAIGDSPE
jgi:hypothetical protein